MADFSAVLHMRESGTFSAPLAVRFYSYSTDEKSEDGGACFCIRKYGDNIRKSKVLTRFKN